MSGGRCGGQKWVKNALNGYLYETGWIGGKKLANGQVKSSGTPMPP